VTLPVPLALELLASDDVITDDASAGLHQSVLSVDLDTDLSSDVIHVFHVCISAKGTKQLFSTYKRNVQCQRISVHHVQWCCRHIWLCREVLQQGQVCDRYKVHLSAECRWDEHPMSHELYPRLVQRCYYRVATLESSSSLLVQLARVLQSRIVKDQILFSAPWAELDFNARCA